MKKFSQVVLSRIVANRGFGMSTYAFLKSVKKFLDKEVRIMPFNNRSRSPPYPSHLLCFVSRCQVIFLESTCQTTLQVQEKLISHLSVEIYVQSRCYCCVRILGQLSGYWATYRSSAKILISRWKQGQNS